MTDARAKYLKMKEKRKQLQHGLPAIRRVIEIGMEAVKQNQGAKLVAGGAKESDNLNNVNDRGHTLPASHRAPQNCGIVNNMNKDHHNTIVKLLEFWFSSFSCVFMQSFLNEMMQLSSYSC